MKRKILYLAGAILMLSLLSNSMLRFAANIFLPKPYSEYRSLSSDMVESETYEIRKLIDAGIDKLLFIPETDVLLVKTGEYLWKINAQGYVVDTWDSKGCMFSSGYCFTEDYFVDWVYTGNKARQKYSKLIDARNMSEGDLIRFLDKAEVVEFFSGYKRVNYYEKKDSDRLAMAFLKMKDHVIALDITNHYDRIDTHCDKIKYEFYFGKGEYQEMGWEKSCLSRYEKKYQDRLKFVRSNLPFDHDREDKSEAVLMQKFVKEGYVIKEGFFLSLWLTIINGISRMIGQPILNKWFLFEGYWLGTAYLQINHHSEKFNFKVPAAYEYDESINKKPAPIAMIDFPGHKNAETKFIWENGLYALRKKISHITKAERDLEESNIILGNSSSYRTHNPWQPVFTGLMSTPTANYHRSKKGRSDSARNRLPTWGKINFYNSKDEPHNYLLGDAVVPTGFYTIPKKLSFNWEGDNTNAAFKLYLDNGQFAWYHLHDANTDEYHLYAPDTDVYLELIFDEAEIVAAFQALDKGKYPLQLEILMEGKGKAEASLSIYLHNKKQRIQLKNNQYAHDKPRYFNDEPFFLQQYERSKLEIEYENALKDGKNLQAYLDVASDIVKNSPYAKEYATVLFPQTNELINISATKNDAKTSEKVIVHFLDKILPYTGRTGKSEDVPLNAEVIASNSLAHAISTRNKELSTVILEKLLGKNFEIKEINNGTLLFNLACYYAVYKDKNHLLMAARQAMIRGKQAEQFMKEIDFKEYWNDPDFMKMLAAAPVASGETEQSNK